MTPPPRKKLIEVALPLEAINTASVRENFIYKGNPSAVHKWWAQRPLATCRAVLFSSLVDDPSSDPHLHNPNGTHNEEIEAERRAQLFNLIEELVKWENSNEPKVIDAARAEIARAVASRLIETGVLKKDTRLGPDGITPWELVVHGKVQTSTSSTKEGKVGILIKPVHRKLPAAAVNAFLAEHAPPVLDPFCGGGSIPLEAQRLGLRAFGSDLNPVPVLITKSLIEIPPKFADQPPVNPGSRGNLETLSQPKTTRSRAVQQQLGMQTWRGAAGLAEDIRHYGRWMRDEARARIGHVYPSITVTKELAGDRKDLKDCIGQDLNVIAWLWARTVPSPNPSASGAPVPLARSFWLSTKEGKKAWAQPIVSADGKSYRFEVRVGTPSKPFDPQKGTVVRTGATCLLTKQPIPFEYIRAEAKEGRMGARLMAIVAEGGRGRVYLSPTNDQEEASRLALPKNIPDTPIPEQALGFRVQLYGMDKHYKLFTNRQLTALTTLSDLVMEARSRLVADGGPPEYADAVATYLAFSLDKAIEYNCTIVPWFAKEDRPKGLFARQAIPMLWDFTEVHPLGTIGGTFLRSLEVVADAVAPLAQHALAGVVNQADATNPNTYVNGAVVCTDPPYYDNIGYADLSDYFYVWLRRSIGVIYPDLFRTLLTPKSEELIATPFRHSGSKVKAMEFFESGLGRAFDRMREAEQGDYPLTVYYAFKQAEGGESEDSDEGVLNDAVASTGWETMLEGLVRAGLVITGTWPVRTERGSRSVGMGTNALASSIVLVCRVRSNSAPVTSRREFVTALKRELPKALRELQSGNIAPVDLAQAAIGPGMAVFSRYAKVLETSGDRMGVRTALALINQILDEVLGEQEAEYDAHTRWAIHWFSDHAHDEGPYGDAEGYCKRFAVGINGLDDTGIVNAKGGKVRLLKRVDLMNSRPETWDPATDKAILHWEVCQYLCWAMETGGEQAAADLLRRINAVYAGAAEVARDLAYRLYVLCERKKWAQEAIPYNALVVAWPEIQKLAAKPSSVPTKAGEETLYG